MKLAVVILNWNGVSLLKEFLPSVIENNSGYNIYIIDNNSDDESVQFIKNNFPNVKIVQNNKNFGFAKGYNEGLKYIKADVYCLLNSDVKVTKNWTKPIQELFNSDNSISAIQPKILSYKNPEYFEFAGAAGGFIDNLGYPFCRGRVYFDLEKDEGQYNDTCQIFWATGACFFIRFKDFWKMNGFDELYFAHMEEIDLCWRLNNDKKKIYYCGESTVYHLGGGTLTSNNPQKTYLNFRNNLLTLLKNLPSKYLLPIIFLRLSLDGVAGIIFWRYHGFGHLKAVILAHLSFYKYFLKYYKNRSKGIEKYYDKKWIVAKYFLQKKKKYSNLI